MEYALNIDKWMVNDPQCPGCKKFHERVRVGKTATFVVKDACNYEGAIPFDAPAKSRAKEE